MQDHGHSPSEIAARLGRSRRISHLRDAVYGGIDGAVTTFAIVAGVAGAGLSPAIILILGAANVLADGFSMAAGNYSATKAELDDRARLYAVEAYHIKHFPDGEREELRQILGAKGMHRDTLDRAVADISSDHARWIDMMLTEEYGLSPVSPAPLRAASITFAAFMMAGIVPLVPFALNLTNAFALSITATSVVFFTIGALKSRWSLAPWWVSGMETLLIGGTAALIAYLVGGLFDV